MTAGRLPRPRFAWLASSKLQGVAHLAAALTTLFTAIALFFAASQLKTSADQGKSTALLQREIAANASWERYMEIASARPEFAAGLDYGRAAPADRTAYGWFVDRMLFAGEQILSFAPNDPQWTRTIQNEARAHKSYLESETFINGSYCDYTSRLRTTVAGAFSKVDKALSDKLARRHSQCIAEGYAL
jgi:hypothetical protein